MSTINKLQHSIPRTKAILAFVLSITLFSLTDGLDFNYSTFVDTNRPDFIFSNSSNSNIAYGALQITPDTSNPDLNYTANKSGRVLYKETFKLWKKDRTIIASFDTNFTINIYPLTNPGGEGLAFILTNNPDLPMNSSGRWLGITNYTMNHSPLNYIVAVEFDTSKSYTDDVDGNHLGINVDGIDSMVQYTLTDFGVNLSSTSDVSVNIRYDGASRLLNINISMAANSTSRSVSLPIDLSLFLLQDVYVGFAGSTSNRTQLNCVKSWSFSGPDIGGGGGGSKNLKWISLSSLILIPIGAIAVFWWRKVRKINPVEAVTRASPVAEHGEFRLEELRLATNNFSEDNILGVGGSGKVYKGFLIGPGRDVAIKRLYNPRLSEKAFEAERETVGRLFHKNLVKLLGWCSEGDESLLVYEYFRKGSLDKLLFPSEANPADDVVSRCWETRLKIIRGVARALEYLHEWCEHVILHRDVKSSNVMVDDEYDARLGDFGLARRVEPVGATHYCTDTVAGTVGYVPPEGLNENWVRKANDVYGFGVFVLEVACGRRPGNPRTRPPRGEGYIVEWLWMLHVNDMLLCGVDHRLEVLDGEQMKRVLLLGLACCHPDYERRPSMGTVSLVLAGLASPPDLPNEMPNFVWASTGGG
ncbi:putative L-type lectin-domain containing receptor kinase S.5 [Acorus calamus]|uniref:non-specific serine/threonine protein kinase n=1 Tax=Acorus calamus TaxID=4465 RepID=A0AAV9FNS1_ACOCL|nr:putative L-type lectin-domain containing receptor kinase S.5 [Acorus calamus]